MLEAFWIPLIPPFFIGLLLSWAMESLLQPRPQAPWNRPLAANLTHIGVWTLAFALELALFRRPYFAVANVLAIQMLLVLVSRAKYQALQEPFVYPDFEYFTDAIKHPRLYLPFFGWKNALASGGGYGLALWAGLTFEDSVTAGAGIWLVSFADLPQESVFDATAPVVPFFMHTALLSVLAYLTACLAGRSLTASFDAGKDLRRWGMMAALWAYALAERKPVQNIVSLTPFSDVLPRNLPRNLPDLVSLQSESFFDVRRAYPIVKDSVLAGFDDICSEAIIHGDLQVAARGANTVRTEFAFLSGIATQDLGVHRYNPYRRLAQHGVATLVSHLRGLGYRTVCVHPYYRSFYDRENVLPALGFDEFIDIEAFSDTDKFGAYVGDIPLAEYVGKLLQDRDGRPLYVHVISMENHGPLHWEKISEKEAEELLNSSVPKNCADLVAYTRHLRNADAMFVSIRNSLKNSGRAAGLCIYGDHVPIMPQVYAELGQVAGDSSYLIWSTENNQNVSRRKTVSASQLGEEFLSHFGLL